MRVKVLFVCIALLVSSSVMAADTVKSITKDEAIADVEQFFSTLQRVHPDLLAKVDIGDYIKLKHQTLDDIDKNLDKDGRININNFAYSLCYAAAFFKDGHTAVHWWRIKPDQADARFPSFILGYDNGRFIITNSPDKSLIGSEVLTINKEPVLNYLQPIFSRMSGETIAYKAYMFSSNQIFWYSFSGLCGSESLAIELQDINDRMQKKTVDTLSYADFSKLNSEKNVSMLAQRWQQKTQVKFFDSDRVAYLIYPSFKYSDDEKTEINGIFESIKAKKSKNLIIDMRGNLGGNSSMGDYIFSFIYDKAFCQVSKVREKLSQDIMSTKEKNYSIPAYCENLIITYSGNQKLLSKPEAFFSGKTFLLTDNGTFSSAVMFASTFRDYHMGKILGYETGGLPISFGDVFSFTLQNSGVECGTSYKQFFNPKPRSGDDEHGVIPDIPMNDKLLRPYHKTDDPILAYTLNYLKDATPIYWQP